MAKPGVSSKVGTAGDGASDSRRALVEAAIETLRIDGFARASARTISARAGCNQGLVFYYFGSVSNLLLASLDAVSADRLERYSEAVAAVASPQQLVEVAATIFREDLDAGYAKVLVEMIAGAVVDTRSRPRGPRPDRTLDRVRRARDPRDGRRVGPRFDRARRRGRVRRRRARISASRCCRTSTAIDPMPSRCSNAPNNWRRFSAHSRE